MSMGNLLVVNVLPENDPSAQESVQECSDKCVERAAAWVDAADALRHCTQCGNA